jgi:hypothetical protein
MINDDERFLFHREVERLLIEHSRCTDPFMKKELYIQINLLNSVLSQR